MPIKNVPALQATPTGATPQKQGLKGTMQAMETNKAIILPAKSKGTNYTEKRVLKQRQSANNQKSESAFTKVPFKREDKQKSSNSALNQQQSRLGASKKSQIQPSNKMRSLISATRSDKIAQSNSNEQPNRKEIQKENLDREYIYMIENAKKEDEMNLSESNSGRDH